MPDALVTICAHMVAMLGHRWYVRVMAPTKRFTAPSRVTVRLVGNIAAGRQDFRASIGPSHEVRGTVAERSDGQLDLVEVTFAAEGDSDITSAVVRAISLPRLLSAVTEEFAATAFWSAVTDGIDSPALSPDERAKVRRRIKATAARVRRSGRPSLDDDHYRWVAVRYLDLLADGKGKLLDRLAAEGSLQMGRPVPKETLRTWVARARDKGFLTPGQKGRAAASAGPRLYESEGR